MNKILIEKFPYLTSFFEAATGADVSEVAHSIILYGGDVLAQYYLALDIAKNLNCKDLKDESCTCRNCGWVKQNKHPAVLTISKIDNKSDSSKTVISKEQIDFVKDSLVNSSDYHRVFIFCDAKYDKLSETEKSNLNEFKYVGFELPQSGDNEAGWYPKGLNRSCFQDVSANALLKLIEEPPSNVTFIFLTEDKNDLISTVVSRSQAFYVPNFTKEEYKTDFLSELFKYYPDFSTDEALDFAKYLIDYQSKQELNSSYVLDCIQAYLKEVVKSNLNNQTLVKKAYKDIEKVQQSKKMLNSYLKEQLVYEDLAFYFAK